MIFSDLSFPFLCAVIESTELRPRKLIRFRSTLRLYTSNPAYLLRRGFRLRHSISRSAFITPPAHIHSLVFFMSWQNWFMFKKIVWIATQAIKFETPTSRDARRSLDTINYQTLFFFLVEDIWEWCRALVDSPNRLLGIDCSRDWMMWADENFEQEIKRRWNILDSTEKTL